MQLNHEKLDVYQAATEFLGLAFQIVANLPPGYGFLSDQLKRAALSIPLNIAEGSGKRGYREQGRFYQIARGSAAECGAILDAIATLRLANLDLAKGKQLLYRIVCMLSKM